MSSRLENELNIGERAITGAPIIKLNNGGQCVPQHYLEYAHTRDSIESLLMDVEYSDQYLPFACEDNGELYIQIGIVGHDNYKSIAKQGGRKIVFGRRWRVEPNLPSSEIIQTVFLAIKKAREHEVRELFRLSRNGKTTTPISSHQDLPLMARNADLLITNQSEDEPIETALSHVSFDGGHFELSGLERRANGQYIVDVNFVMKTGLNSLALPHKQLTLLCNSTESNAIIYALTDEIIRVSDQHVDEHFTYKGLARFSRDMDIFAIADLSVATRKKPKNSEFSKTLIASNYETDTSRVPSLHPTPYGEKVKQQIKALNVVNGIIPRQCAE